MHADDIFRPDTSAAPDQDPPSAAAGTDDAGAVRLLRMVPVRETMSLELVWAVPPSAPQYRSQPLGYLSHLLGHEGAWAGGPAGCIKHAW